MCVFRVWRVLCVLCYVGASLCVNRVEYEMNYADSYDNEISQDQQEGEFLLFFWSFDFPSLFFSRQMPLL